MSQYKPEPRYLSVEHPDQLAEIDLLSIDSSVEISISDNEGEDDQGELEIRVTLGDGSFHSFVLDIPDRETWLNYEEEQYHLQKEEEPDKNCITLPDGSCVGSNCMHDPQPGE